MPDIAIDFPLEDDTVQHTFAAGGRVICDGPGTVVCKLIHRETVFDTKTDAIAAAGNPNPWGVVLSVNEDLDPCEVVAEFFPQGSNTAAANFTLSPITVQN